MQQLLQMFLDLPDGAKIMSLKNFVPKDHTITIRNADSCESILKVREIPYAEGNVSWTNKAGYWYLHVVDRSRVTKFWQEQQSKHS
jgi:H3 lysine-79-specific histone-lysine N-methyltransferase